MLKLRTKTKFNAPIERGNVNVIIRLIVDKLEIDANNYVAKGYYYCYDDNGVFHKLHDGEIDTLMLRSDIALIQPSLPLLGSDIDTVANTDQRLKEFVFYKLNLENGTNWGTTAADFEDDIEPIEEPEV